MMSQKRELMIPPIQSPTLFVKYLSLIRENGYVLQNKIIQELSKYQLSKKKKLLQAINLEGIEKDNQQVKEQQQIQIGLGQQSKSNEQQYSLQIQQSQLEIPMQQIKKEQANILNDQEKDQLRQIYKKISQKKKDFSKQKVLKIVVPAKNHQSLEIRGKLLTIVDSPGFNHYDFQKLVIQYIKNKKFPPYGIVLQDFTSPSAKSQSNVQLGILLNKTLQNKIKVLSIFTKVYMQKKSFLEKYLENKKNKRKVKYIKKHVQNQYERHLKILKGQLEECIQPTAYLEYNQRFEAEFNETDSSEDDDEQSKQYMQFQTPNFMEKIGQNQVQNYEETAKLITNIKNNINIDKVYKAALLSQQKYICDSIPKLLKEVTTRNFFVRKQIEKIFQVITGQFIANYLQNNIRKCVDQAILLIKSSYTLTKKQRQKQKLHKQYDFFMEQCKQVDEDAKIINQIFDRKQKQRPFTKQQLTFIQKKLHTQCSEAFMNKINKFKNQKKLIIKLIMQTQRITNEYNKIALKNKFEAIIKFEIAENEIISFYKEYLDVLMALKPIFKDFMIQNEIYGQYEVKQNLYSRLTFNKVFKRNFQNVLSEKLTQQAQKKINQSQDLLVQELMQISEYKDIGLISLSSFFGIGSQIGGSIGYFVATTIARTVLSVVFFWVGLALLSVTPIGLIAYYFSWNHQKIANKFIKDMLKQITKNRDKTIQKFKKSLKKAKQKLVGKYQQSKQVIDGIKECEKVLDNIQAQLLSLIKEFQESQSEQIN